MVPHGLPWVTKDAWRSRRPPGLRSWGTCADFGRQRCLPLLRARPTEFRYENDLAGQTAFNHGKPREIPSIFHRWLVGLALWWGLAAPGHAETPVFRDGQRALAVFVAATAAPEERAAAAELARVLGVMSGLSWQVQPEGRGKEKGFYVGRTKKAAKLGAPLTLAADWLAPRAGESGPDAFRLRTFEGNIFIEGATPEATRFAVSWLLQQEGGVRWYAPGSMGEIVPRRTAWILPDLALTREPAYLSRTIYDLGGAEGNEWAERNGLRGRLEFNHALDRVFPPALLDVHPDWAPWLRGKRYRPATPNDFNWQPNLALPAVAAHAAGAAMAAFARDPDRTSFSLAMNDTLRFDQGLSTRALVEPLQYFRGMPDYSPLVFTFMNRAAEAMKDVGPGRYLGCLAYFWCESPPPFPVHPRVVPYVTTDRTQYYDAAYRAADLDLMSRWARSGVRAYGLWEYGEGGNFLVPRVPMAALAGAVREGWQRGARGYFAEVGAHGGFDRFKVWALAQLLWEPERPLAELADDFFSGYYGRAAAPMRRFFERCEAQWMAQSGPPYWLKFYQQEDQALLFPPSVCRELRAELTAATAAAEDPVVAARVAWTSRAFAVTEAYVAFDDVRRQLAAVTVPDSVDPRRDEPQWSALLGNFLQARARLAAAFDLARQGETPAMVAMSLAYFVRNDPVPRLLWLAGLNDPAAPLRLLAKAGVTAADEAAWLELAEALAQGGLAAAPNQATNSSFEKEAATGPEPRWLFPLSGALPADWEVHSTATQTGRVALMNDPGQPARRCLRVEGAWDTQVYQWRPAQAGRIYVATAELRGTSSPGNDSGLFFTFLSAAGRVVGTHRMQCLPKGETADWRTMVLADLAPVGTAWVGLGIGASRQTDGDWIEAAAVELRSINREPGS